MKTLFKIALVAVVATAFAKAFLRQMDERERQLGEGEGTKPSSSDAVPTLHTMQEQVLERPDFDQTVAPNAPF